MRPCKQMSVMDELLYGEAENATATSQEENNQLLYLFAEPPSCSTTGKEKTSASGRTKKKVTHYLNHGTRHKLDEFREQLLLLFPGINKLTFSRSNIVDKALEVVIGRFQHGNDQHELLARLLGKG